MNNKERKNHWETIYSNKPPSELSWTQDVPSLSLAMIESLKLPKDAPIIDVGGGESQLVDHLLKLGYTDLSVLDISSEALKRSKKRLGISAQQIDWIVADITTFQPKRNYVLWHDRAVFHFLTEKENIQHYANTVKKYVDQHLLLSTFSLDGPKKCSGLPITQYSVETLSAIFSSAFSLIKSAEEMHNTPFETTQAFIYGHFNKMRN